MVVVATVVVKVNAVMIGRQPNVETIMFVRWFSLIPMY